MNMCSRCKRISQDQTVFSSSLETHPECVINYRFVIGISINYAEFLQSREWKRKKGRGSGKCSYKKHSCEEIVRVRDLDVIKTNFFSNETKVGGITRSFISKH